MTGRAATRKFLTDTLPANGRPPEVAPDQVDRAQWPRMAESLASPACGSAGPTAPGRRGATDY